MLLINSRQQRRADLLILTWSAVLGSFQLQNRSQPCSTMRAPKPLV